MNKQLKIITNNKVGVLVRITGLISRFGLEVNQITVNTENDSQLFEIKLTLTGQQQKIDQIKKLIEKQIDVMSVQDECVKDVEKSEYLEIDETKLLSKVKAKLKVEK